MAITYRRRDNLKGTEAEAKIGEAIRQGFAPLGDDIVTSIKARSPVDRGRFKAATKKRISGAGLRTRMLIFNDAKHAEFVEGGRRKGKQPPPEVMLGWVRRKGLGARGFGVKSRRAISAGTRRTFNRSTGKRRTASQSLLQLQKSIAFLIGRKIGRDGIKGLFLFRDVKSDFASKISSTMVAIQGRVARILNA